MERDILLAIKFLVSSNFNAPKAFKLYEMENNQFCLSVQISSERSSSLFPGILCKNAFDLSNQIFYTKTSLLHRVVLILDGHAMITLISKQEAWYQYQSIDGLYRPATNRRAITYSPTHRPTDHRPTDPLTQ